MSCTDYLNGTLTQSAHFGFFSFSPLRERDAKDAKGLKILKRTLLGMVYLSNLHFLFIYLVSLDDDVCFML